MFMINVDVTTP